MATIKISNLFSTSLTRIRSEEELLNTVSESVARAIKARGSSKATPIDPITSIQLPSDMFWGMIYIPHPPCLPVAELLEV